MDFYFQGLAWFNKGLSPENVVRARSFFDLALTVDPDNAEALIGSAAADIVGGANLFVTDPIATFAAAEAKLTKALFSGPRPCAWPYVLGTRRYLDQARGRRHRRM